MTPNSSGGSQITVDRVKPAPSSGGEPTRGVEASNSNDENTNETLTHGSKGPEEAPASPQVHMQQYQPGYAPQLTPQAGAGYYFLGNHQVTPEPPSPATPGYDVNSFLQHQAAALGVHHGNPFGTGQYGGIPQPPLSPSRIGMSGGLIPPASPLFPRAATNPGGSFDQQNQLDSSVFQRIQGQNPASPMPYMTSPSLGPSNGGGFGGAYQGYAASTGTYASVLSGANAPGVGGDPSASPDDRGWGVDRNNYQQPQYPHASPQQGQFPSPYPTPSRNNRSYSFDESMLPPSVLDQQDQASAPYSPYSSNQGASGNTLFAAQPWGYPVSGDMYNPPQSPLQPRQSPHMQPHYPGGHPGMGPPQMHHMAPYGGQPPMAPYYPATSPGPPIQTTASNKGPDGANLFIFHIPNHFTNLDMYRLFCQYGNLLSVRIMVEKDTGRSRGFGFVSYDSPESAALAIKELNGFAIGNKRLKVQHKQIRGDQPRNSFMDAGDPSFMPRPGLPHGGPPPSMGMGPSWYGEGDPATHVEEEHEDTDGIQSEHLVSAPELQSISGDQASGAGLSPLATMDPLRSALPEVAGHAGTAE